MIAVAEKSNPNCFSLISCGEDHFMYRGATQPYSMIIYFTNLSLFKGHIKGPISLENKVRRH